MTSAEDYLRGLAERFLAEDRRQWHHEFFTAAGALQAVGAVEYQTSQEIQFDLEAAFNRRDGIPERVRPTLSHRRPRIQSPAEPRPAAIQVRAAWTWLPATYGDGAVNFLTTEGDQAFLICSGAGQAPWPDRRPPEPPIGTLPIGTVRWVTSPPAPAGVPPFLGVIDEKGTHYQLTPDSSGSSDSAGKRRRWDLRAQISPVPAVDTAWLELETEHGPIRAQLTAPVKATITSTPLHPALSPAERYLLHEAHQQAWSYLLDPERTLERLDPATDALVAVDAIAADNPAVRCAAGVDDVLAGGEPVPEMPAPLSVALNTVTSPDPWRGAAAVGVRVDALEGVILHLEALVGHADRTALHFYSPATEDGFMGSVYGRTVTCYATDDLGGGYVAHADILFGSERGAYHFRPAVNSQASNLDVRLENAVTSVTVSMDLSPT